MKILIIGGTVFLGRHVAQQAIDAGHELTLLNRGRSNASLFPQARHLRADRNGDLALLEDGRWDCVIDTSAYFPRQVRALAGRLAGRVGQYQMVSTISVYDGFVRGGGEDAPLARLADPGVETVTGETYGGLKALCEEAAAAEFPGRCLIPRPGLIVGPFDPSGRFTWWVQRMSRAATDGGEVLAPGDPGAPVQFIDARDLAAWMLLQAERGTTGIYNLAGPAQRLSMGDLLATARDVLAPQARLTWVDAEFLLAAGVAPWSDLPLWLPPADDALHEVGIARALATGLRCRPLRETIADTAAWAASLPPPAPSEGGGTGMKRPVPGLPAAREAQLLADWHRRPPP